MDSGRAEEECRRAEARMRGHMFEAKEARRNLPFQRFWTTRSPGHQITRSLGHPEHGASSAGLLQIRRRGEYWSVDQLEVYI